MSNGIVIYRVTIGVVGQNPDGTPVESVVVNYGLQNGKYRNQIDWEMDTEDRDWINKLSDYLGPKIEAAYSNETPFEGNGQAMGFEAE